ncbi:hypothetical protein LSAT2_007562 [Lamellibrachia satsuma]|nr:hypothetical protein LSAT2_007562 [Lamellibrachia satsuma]
MLKCPSLLFNLEGIFVRPTLQAELWLWGGIPRRDYYFRQQNQFAVLSSGGQLSRGGRPGGAGGGAAPNIKDLPNDDIINIISQEMAQWDQSHMWQFSCFSYTKETPCLPGMEDLSHEEVRLKAYEAQKAGSFDSYKQWIAQLTNDYKAKKKELINPSPPMRIKLQEVINSLKAATPGGAVSEPTKGTFGYDSSFGTPANSQLRGATGDGTYSQHSLFGASQPNVFAGSPSANQNAGLFGAASQPSGGGGFGGSANTFGSAGSELFGKSGASSVFGGGTATGQQTGGLFGKPASTGQTSTFGGAQPIFGGSGGTFGGSAQSAFGGTTAQDLSTQSTFGGTAQSTFGSAQTSFGGQLSQATQPSIEESSLYMPMDKLTKEERAQFEATTFSLGKIPTRPPPRELV